jgi:hypothetical protein
MRLGLFTGHALFEKKGKKGKKERNDGLNTQIL